MECPHISFTVTEVMSAMLIHSVTPPHMLSDPPEYPQMKTRPFDGGYIEGFDTPQGFQVSRLLSTDPKRYLDKQYMPGGIYKQANESTVKRKRES